MTIHSLCPFNIDIRNARPDDIHNIGALVQTCGPYLSHHQPYLYFIYTRYYFDTCLVATYHGSMIGWCSVLSVARDRYYMHQLGIVPAFRGSGAAFDLFANLLGRLRARHGDDFSLEFTNDTRNGAVHRLNRKIAETFCMELQRLPDLVPCMEAGVTEELYRMTPLRELNVHLADRLTVAA
ncbi:GNAT family N-acetyltransferase [Acidicapsa acidisoli]|uniref:GNAT family N-acetyltransferase n=1 Tax=Acidicapsa acidisoli TaxID=1615681 RepID=UPI0021E0A97B|nr:GNAT family N-acetyltransferase [Acidicapsa acidisoli]